VWRQSGPLFGPQENENRTKEELLNLKEERASPRSGTLDGRHAELPRISRRKNRFRISGDCKREVKNWGTLL